MAKLLLDSGLADHPRAARGIEPRSPYVHPEQHRYAALGQQLPAGEILHQRVRIEYRKHARDRRRPHVAQPAGVDREKEIRAAALGGQRRRPGADGGADQELAVSPETSHGSVDAGEHCLNIHRALHRLKRSRLSDTTLEEIRNVTNMAWVLGDRDFR